MNLATNNSSRDSSKSVDEHLFGDFIWQKLTKKTTKKAIIGTRYQIPATIAVSIEANRAADQGCGTYLLQHLPHPQYTVDNRITAVLQYSMP